MPEPRQLGGPSCTRTVRHRSYGQSDSPSAFLPEASTFIKEKVMDIAKILTDLRGERDRLDQAIAALESLNSPGAAVARRGRPPATAARKPERPKGGTTFEYGANEATNKPPHGGRRTMSAAAKKRISEGAKRRWARLRAISESKAPEAKKATVARKAAPARHMSAAARKRISEAAKKRWAARRKAAKTA